MSLRTNIIRSLKTASHSGMSLTGRAFLCGALTLCTIQRIEAQTESTTSAPAEPAPSSGSAKPEDTLETMTIEELLAAALVAVEHAEARGPDADEALNQANRFINMVLARDANHKQARYLQARVLVLTGRIYDALSALQEWANAPAGQSDWKVFKLLGDIYRDTFPNLAVPKYQQAGQLNPRDPAIFQGLSQSYIKLGRFDEAVKAAQDAVAADVADEPAFRQQLVSALVAANKIKEAEDEAVKMVERTRTLVEAVPSDAVLLTQLAGRVGVLMDILRSGVATGQATVQTYLRLSQYTLDRAAIAHQLAYHDAIREIELGIKASGKAISATLLLEHARLLIAIGRRLDAINELRLILDAEPNNTAARDLLAELQPSPPSSN